MRKITHRASVADAATERRVTGALAAAGVTPVLASVLAARGVASPDEAAGRYKLIHYRSMRNIRVAAELLAAAVRGHERVTVVADYDTDGCTACTIAVRGLRALGADVGFVVPNRFKHGYGLTPSVVDVVHERYPQTRLIVTVDNGIASVDGVDRANALGMGVLVTDHHLPGDSLPAARTIVNPNQAGCDFPSKALAGCGVMYYVLGATRDVLAAGGWDVSRLNMQSLLDFVALGTVADVVRLDANNRWLVNHGIARIRRGETHPGIAAIFTVARRNLALASSRDFGFTCGPRLNAAGRMEDMSIGIRCMLTDDSDEAMELARQLDAINRARRATEQRNLDTALAQQEAAVTGAFTRVAFSDTFHEGVIGLVASKLREESGAPAVVFAPAENGQLKGSARSIPSVHMRDTLDRVHKRGHGLFERFGGHAAAAGMTMATDRLGEFSELFESTVKESLGGKLPSLSLEIDGELPSSAITPEVAHEFCDVPWGQGFEEPLWLGSFKVLAARPIGKDSNHVKMRVTDGKDAWDALHFFSTDLPVAGSEITMAYRLGYDEFRDTPRVSLVIEDRE